MIKQLHFKTKMMVIKLNYPKSKDFCFLKKSFNSLPASEETSTVFSMLIDFCSILSKQLKSEVGLKLVNFPCPKTLDSERLQKAQKCSILKINPEINESVQRNNK